MTDVALVSLEDVIMRPLDSPASSVVIPQGLKVVSCIATNYSVVLASHSLPFNDIVEWLAHNGLSKLVLDVLGFEDGRSDDALLTECRRRYGCHLVVTASPPTAVNAVRLGMQTLMYCEPAYTRSEFRPDDRRGIRSWSELEEAVSKDRIHLRQHVPDEVVGDVFEH